MRQILDLTVEMAAAQERVANAAMSMPSPGSFTPSVREHFESQGHNVGWHGNNQFSINGQMFDASQFVNLNGSLQATYQQLRDLERQLENIPRFDTGGHIDRDTLAVVHRGERVLTVDQTRAWESGKLMPLQISGVSLDELHRKITEGIGTGNLSFILQ